MENKDLMIYNAVANVAARVFETFDNAMFQPGKYDVPAVLAVIKKIGKYFHDEDAETAANEIVKIEFDTFRCSFLAIDSFELLKRLADVYQIPTASRAQFTKKADASPVAVSFRVFAGLKDLCSRVSKDDLHPCFNYICVDTKRRSLIVCDQYTLSAVPVPEMFVSEDAKETYLITPAVLKPGHGVCNIAVNGTATNSGAVSAVDEEIKYPDISRVLFAVPSEFITLGKKTFAEIKKNVAAAAKFGKVGTYETPVILKADAGANEIEIIGYKEKDGNETEKAETRRAVVSLPQPVPFAFAVAVYADRIKKVLSAEKMYLKDNNSAVCFVDETRRLFTVMYPKDLSKTPWQNSTFSVPVAADSLPVDAVAGTFTHAVDAPAAPFTDEETAPAVPAVSEETKITYITKNFVPEITDEIKNAVAVAAEYRYLEYKLNMFGTRSRREHTPAVCAAELLLQRENLYIENYALICGNGQTFAYISVHDEELNVNYDVQGTAAPVDEETQMYNDYLAAAAESETAAAVQDEETPAVFAKVDQYAVNDESGNAVVFETYAPQLGTDEETANVQDEETVPAVQETPAAANVPAVAANDIETLLNKQFETYLAAVAVAQHEKEINAEDAVAVEITDEETAPAVQDAPDVQETAAAVSLPVPVAAAVWYAVYQNGKLENVHFSKLLADEIVINSLFVAGETKDLLAVPSPAAAPAVFPAVAVDETPAVDEETAPDVPQDEETSAVLIVCPADEETPAVDEETAAPADPFVSVWACMPETPAVDEETAPGVPVDEEPPAVLIAFNFARRFRRVWQTAAAVLFLIVCAAVPVTVSVQDAPAVPADSITAPAVPAAVETPAVAVSVAADSETPAAADSVPQTAKKQPKTAKKRARRGNSRSAVSFAAVTADSLAADSITAPAVAAADSVPAVPVAADSLYLAADSITAAPADSVPANSITAPAVAVDEETPDADSVPAVDEETPQDEGTAPAVPADSVPADSVPNSPAPDVPAVQCAPAVPVAPVAPIVIAYFGN